MNVTASLAAVILMWEPC